MPSQKSANRRPTVSFDPETALVGDVGLLLNPHFAQALYEELRSARGPERARNAVAQIGCLHGLRDAARAVGARVGLPDALDTVPAAPALAVHLRGCPDLAAGGDIEIRGCWPEQTEAAGSLSIRGLAGEPACTVSAGYTSGWLSGILDTDLVAVETCCKAAGDASCDFVAREIQRWRATGDAHGCAAADALPIGELRRALAAITPASEDTQPVEDPVVHTWGPVMIVPFASVDEALTAVDLLHSDPGLAEVSVIVIDVTEYVSQNSLDASALVPIVAAITNARAETVFAGASPALEAAITRLDPAPVLVCTNLDAAIAASFQIAESQRRPA